MIELRDGEKRKLSELTASHALSVRINHDLPGAELSLFGVSAERKLQDDRYFIFYNQLSSPQREIQLHLGPNAAQFDLNLSALPPSVQRLVFAITHDRTPLRQLQQLHLGLLDSQERGYMRLSGAQLSHEQALMIGELYQHNGEWRVAKVAQGFNGGLQALLGYFGGQTAAPSPASAPAGPPSFAPPPFSPAPAPSSPPPMAVPTPPAAAPYTPPSPPPSSQGSDSSGLGTSLNDFLRQSAEQDRPGDVFELESSKMLEVKVRGRVWSKLGAMVAYKGRLEFKRASSLRDVMGGMRSGGGLGGLLGGVMNAALRSQEMGPLVSIEGQGICYLADQGKEITIIKLQGEAINVNGQNLLAFEDTVGHQVTMQRSIAGMIAGGLFSVRMQGHGLLAILSHGKPLTLRVTPHEPVYTDPNATIGWSDHLQPDIRVDHDLRSLMGRGGGETLQMAFRGDGFVVVQPYEDTPAMEHIPNH